MAMKMARLFGGEARAAENTDFDAPTTQVRMGIHSPEGYDPPSTMSVMDQLRTASNASRTAASRMPQRGSTSCWRVRSP